MRRAGRLIAAALSAALAVLALAPTAGATPTGDYAPFAQCDFGNVAVEFCLHADFSSGSYTVGTRTIPIVNPITLQGGYSGAQFYAASGQTLPATPQPVPGGLLGVLAPNTWPVPLQNAFNETINEGYTGVDATLVLAEPPSAIEFSTENLLFEEGVALSLPVKVKLENPILGSNCFIESESGPPLEARLTTGISGALEGAAGSVSFDPGFTIATFSGTEAVDGIAEGAIADGCGGIAQAYVDPLVESILGLSSSSGLNAVELSGELEVGEAAAVLANDM